MVYNREDKIKFTRTFHQLGPKEAKHEFLTSHPDKGRQADRWNTELIAGKSIVPEEGKQRRKGGGDKHATTWKQECLVIDDCMEYKTLHQRSVPYSYARERLLYHCTIRKTRQDGQPRAYSRSGKGFACSDSFLDRMYLSHNFDPKVKETKKGKQWEGDPEETEKQGVIFLAQLAQFKVNYTRNHYKPENSEGRTVHPMEWLSHVHSMTVDKVSCFDEIKLPFEHEDDKNGCTVAFRTTANGEITHVLVILDKKTHPEYHEDVGVVDVEGVNFFIVFNDTHYNNKVVMLLWYDHITSRMQPHECGYPGCNGRFEIYDRFSGHFSQLQDQIQNALRIGQAVCMDTTRWQPNDGNLHHVFKRDFWDVWTLLLQTRSDRSTRFQEEKAGALPALSKRDKEQITIYLLRTIL